jgi:hypothetical protein
MSNYSLWLLALAYLFVGLGVEFDSHSNPLVVGFVDESHYFISYLTPVFQRAAAPREVNLKRLGASEINPDACDLLVYGTFGKQHTYFTSMPRLLLNAEPSTSVGLPYDLLLDCKNETFLRSAIPYVYLPFYMLSFSERWANTPNDLIKVDPDIVPVDAITHQKSKFCAFMYRNQVAFRNQLYDLISTYKTVDSLGLQRGTSSASRSKPDYNDIAVEKYRPYKFVIACENSRHEGYVTEKIISAMLAKAIPIYLGAPDVAAHFNPKAFIDVGSFPSWADALAYIAKVDNDEALYHAMLREPWFASNTLPTAFDPDYLLPALKAFVQLAVPAQLQPATPVKKKKTKKKTRISSDPMNKADPQLPDSRDCSGSECRRHGLPDESEAWRASGATKSRKLSRKKKGKKKSKILVREDTADLAAADNFAGLNFASAPATLLTSAPRAVVQARSSWHERVGRVFYINLDARTDRRSHMEAVLASLGVSPAKIQRIPGVVASPGFVGCAQAHLNAVEAALRGKHKWVAIFEDDFSLLPSPAAFTARVDQAWSELEGHGDFDVLSLANSPVNLERVAHTGASLHTQDLHRVLRALGMPGVIVSWAYLKNLKAMYKEALEEYKPIDVILSHHQRAHRWYGFFPPIARQMPGFSDIEKGFRDYQQLELQGSGLSFDPHMLKEINR